MSERRDRDRRDAILDQLIARTENGSQHWQKTSMPWSFTSEIGPAEAEVGSQDGDDLAPFRLTIRSSSGIDAEEVRTQALPRRETLMDPMGLRQSAVQERNAKLDRLYTLAKRQVYGLDEVLAEVEKELGIESSD